MSQTINSHEIEFKSSQFSAAATPPTYPEINRVVIQMVGS